MRVDPGEGLQAEAVGQRQVEQHQHRLARGELLEAVLQALGAMQREGRLRLLRQHLADQPGVARVVLDEEDLVHVSVRSAG
jgi:hypothetical protein